MKIKQGDHWFSGKLKLRNVDDWIDFNSLFIKDRGAWKIINGTQVIQVPMSDMVSNPSYWQFDPTVGWYVNTYHWGTFYPTVVPTTVLERIRKVSAVFTGYYDYPAGCLGENGIYLVLSDGSTVSIGTYDGHTSGDIGQTINAGDAGVVNSTMRNVIQERFTVTIPTHLKVVGLYLRSSGYNGNGNNYSFSLRGMKDFEFTLEY